MSSILSSILGGASAAPAQDAQPAAPAGGDSYGSSDPTSCIKKMIADGKRYLDEEPDQQDLAEMHDILLRLQKLLAKDQADAEGALKGQVSPRLVRKAGAAAAGGSSGGGY